MPGPQPWVGARHARRVAEAPADRRCPALQLARGELDEQVRHDVREVRHDAHAAVVDAGLDRLRSRPERRDEAVQPLEQHPVGPCGRREVPDGAVEEIGARVRDARGLRAGDRMAADEPRVAPRRRHDRRLHRADVADDAVRPGGAQRRLDEVAEDVHRRRGERGVGVRRAPRRASALPRRRRRARARRRGRRGRDPTPSTCAPARSRVARPTDPPMRPSPRTATRIAGQTVACCRTLPATAAACSTRAA